MSDSLKNEFHAFYQFCTTRFFGQQTDPIAPVTARKYMQHIRWVPLFRRGFLHKGVESHGAAGCVAPVTAGRPPTPHTC
jgi:hypothetical protein